MNFLTGLIKIAIKWTPKVIILWVVNYQLKGIAEVKDFDLELDERKVYVHTQLFGEVESRKTSEPWMRKMERQRRF